jgi:TonB family protein
MFIPLKKTAFRAGFLLLCAPGLVPLRQTHAQEKQEKGNRKVVKKVDPTYPPLAGRLHLAGSVKMELQVTAEGKVENVRTTGGSPILAAAAESAVKQWKYEAAPKESSEAVVITFEAPK